MNPLGFKGPARGRYSPSIPVGWGGARWAVGGGVSQPQRVRKPRSLCSALQICSPQLPGRLGDLGKVNRVTLLRPTVTPNFSPSAHPHPQDCLGREGSPGLVERQVPWGLSDLPGSARCPRDQPSVPSAQRVECLRQPTHPYPSTACC